MLSPFSQTNQDALDLFFGRPYTLSKLLVKMGLVSRNLMHGGCRRDCQWRRTDDTRLPWESHDEYGGWGGCTHFETSAGTTRPPVVFVHGNQRDACDWRHHADTFLDRGCKGDDLWSITFADGTPTHDEMAAQLDDFVSHVRAETGRETVSIVAHSLGVTGSRYWMDTRERYEWVETFVGLAGANHGTRLSTLCDDVGYTHGPYRISWALRDDYQQFDDHPLTRLNDGVETPGDIDYYTVRGRHDTLFWRSKQSPCLDGAVENLEVDASHDGVRTDKQVVESIFEWTR